MLEQGIYVRVPLIITAKDMRNPRTFILAQVVSEDELKGTVEVKIWDLFNCKEIYPFAFKVTEFPSSMAVHCKSPVGFPAMTPNGRGKIVATGRSKNSEQYNYLIEFPNNSIAKFNESQLKLDFSAYDMDPIDMLRRYELQNPSWLASRYPVSATMHVLNNAVYGFRVLAGCRAFMMPHQVTTVIRCLQSENIRYMLADEVGLGKTIEACSIVKIQKSRKPMYHTLYIVPKQLKNQWKFELRSKFEIDTVDYAKAMPDDCDVLMDLGQVKNLKSLALLSDFDLVIVDETHNILSDAALYSRIKTISRSVKNILLLSATPISSRQQEYMKLLSLLDPDRYTSLSPERFNELVLQQRDLEQQMYNLLSDIRDFGDFSESIIEQLAEIAESIGDEQLVKKVRAIDPHSDDAGYKEVMESSAYICEEFRLEKNVIRNRRALISERMASRRHLECTYPMADASLSYGENDVVEELLSWLSQVSNPDKLWYDTIAQPLLAAAFSSPWALEEAFKSVLSGIPSSIREPTEEWRKAAEVELSRVNTLLDAHPEQIRGRLLHVLDYLEQETDLCSTEPFKVVIFTNFTETLKALDRLLKRRTRSYDYAVFCDGLTNAELENNATAFQRDPNCRVMLCDALGTEGRNFQNADMVVHIDIPWNANQLEQRIGRLDRLGREPDKDVVSLAVLAEDTIEEQLFGLWRDGLGIFEHSMSGLEIITGDIEDQIRQAVTRDLRYGLRDALPDIQQQTEEMRMAVEEEQFYDMTAVLYRPLSVTVARMLEMYQGKEDQIFAEAMLSWASQTGLVASDKAVTGIRFSPGKFSPAAAANAFLIPPQWNRYRSNTGTIDGTFNRGYAVKREDLLFFAPGDTVFDSITSNAVTCARGRASAFRVGRAPFNFTGLVLIWNVEPNMLNLYRQHIDPIMMARFRAFLPLEQVITPYPEDESSESVTAEMLDALLKQRYVIRDADHLGRRSASHKGEARLDIFKDAHPKAYWNRWLLEAKQQCRETAKKIVMDKWDIETAKEEALRMINAEKAADAFYGVTRRRASNTELQYNSVVSALEDFRVILDAAIYLEARTDECI